MIDTLTKRTLPAVAVALATLVGPAAVPLEAVAAAPAPRSVATVAMGPHAVALTAAARLPMAAGACPTTVRRPFFPVRIRAAGRRSPVVAPRRSHGQPGVPPLSTAGKRAYAFDRYSGIYPGSKRGNVLLNAHTWPDGSALGNQLLRALYTGSRIVVRGTGTQVMCYRVTQRLQVPAGQRYPRYYSVSGSPRLAIVVCSGRRLGPGRWTHRTIWFASPSR